MTDSRSLFGIFIFTGILLFAVWLGISIVTDQIETLMYVVAGGTLITCALLGRKIWLIIPFMASLDLSLMIPGQPTTLLLAQLLFLGFCTLLFLSRKLPFKIQITELEIWSILLTLCVIQVYVRNPVGLNILGGGAVGGRPYVIFGITLVSSLLLGFLRVPSSDIRWILRLSIFGGILNFALSTIGYFIPKVGVWYGAVEVQSLVQTGIEKDARYGIVSATRVGFLSTAATNISLWISSFKAPVRACFHPVWAPLILISLAFAAFSGFRNAIAAVGFTYLVGIVYRGGLPATLIATSSLILAIALLAFVNLAAPLPANIQRSLSFLPGTWDELYVEDAESSTKWRVDMWKEALLTDFWIQNKILGDGLGLTREELNFIQSLEGENVNTTTSMGGLSLQQQSMMATGAYHSGPVSTIRTIGYIGLFILILAQIRLAVHAHRQIKRAKNTEWFPLTLLIGIPIIWSPIFFVFVFGDFGKGAAAFLMSAAMIRLLKNNLPLSKNLERKQNDSQPKLGDN